MRYLAQFSEAPRTGTHAFWQDAVSTENWLDTLGKDIVARRLTLRSRTVRALEPWLQHQSKPLAIDAWLDPMDITVTWNYLVRFLAEMGPERVWIPCGDDAWVGWTADQLVIRASRESWLWALVEDVWDPASWTNHDELEWWADNRLQTARRMAWGTSVNRSWATGWEEGTLSADPTVPGSRETLMNLWVRLSERLGSRPVRVKWLQETAPSQEQLLGIKARYITCDLTVNGDGRYWLDRLRQTPEPSHLRAHATWQIPTWSPEWGTIMTLRRVQRGSRLEATYSPRAPLSTDSWRALQQERRQIPILQIRPLLRGFDPEDRWQQLQVEAARHVELERLTTFLKEYSWPEKPVVPEKRVRPPERWSIWRWASQPGLWVVRSTDGVEIQVEWPTRAHPGNIGIALEGASPIPMNEWARESRFKRLSHDRQYWTTWIAHILIPAVETWRDAPNP